MENRESVVAEYFKLRVLLNRTNLIKDQRSEVEFVAVKVGHFEYRVDATLKGIGIPKHLEICKTDRKGLWTSSNYSGLFYLEDFCVNYLSERLKRNFELGELRIAVESLKKELESLGISQQ